MSDHAIKAMENVRKLLLPAWYLPNGTMNASEDELEGASSSCENWALVCGALVIVSVIAEIIIAAIKPPYGLFLELSAVTDIGIAIGIVGEVLLGMRNNRLQTELRRRSNEQLASAKLELARLSTSRSDLLKPEAVGASIVERLKPFAGTKFDIGHSKYGREEWDFLWWLEPLPAKARWIFLDWVPGLLPHPGVFPKLNWTLIPRVYGVANVSNVVIELTPENREKLLPAAMALAEALKAVGIAAAVGAPQPINWISTSADAIHVLVGPKE